MKKFSKKNVVVISGGNGSFVTINALKNHLGLFDISAVIPMSDSGGSSGELRKEFGVLPTGDIMRAILAMSQYDSYLLKKIFYRKRFENSGKLDGHNFGNLFLVLAEKYDGNFIHALKALHQAVGAVGTVHPVTLEESDLVVELSNGDIINGEHKIDRPVFDRSLRIKKAWLEPEVSIYSRAKKAIEDADVITIGPGSLYCSDIATLLVPGVREVIEKNKKAKLIYISGSAYEKNGETGPTTISESVQELEHYYLPRSLDFIVYNGHTYSKKELTEYKKRDWGVIEYDSENLSGRKVIIEDYEGKTGGLDTKKLGVILKHILA